MTASLILNQLMLLTIVPKVKPAFSAALSGVMLLIRSPGPVKAGSNETPKNGLVDLPVAINSSAIRFALLKGIDNLPSSSARILAVISLWE